MKKRIIIAMIIFSLSIFFAQTGIDWKVINQPLKVFGDGAFYGNLYPLKNASYNLGDSSSSLYYWKKIYSKRARIDSIWATYINIPFTGDRAHKSDSLWNRGRYMYGDNFLRSDVVDTANFVYFDSIEQPITRTMKVHSISGDIGGTLLMEGYSGANVVCKDDTINVSGDGIINVKGNLYAHKDIYCKSRSSYLVNASENYLFGGTNNPSGGYIETSITDAISFGIGEVPVKLYGSQVYLDSVICFFYITDDERVSVDLIEFQGLNMFAGSWNTLHYWDVGASYGGLHTISIPFSNWVSVSELASYRILISVTKLDDGGSVKVYGCRVVYHNELISNGNGGGNGGIPE